MRCVEKQTSCSVASVRVSCSRLSAAFEEETAQVRKDIVAMLTLQEKILDEGGATVIVMRTPPRRINIR